jgi:hypothetical protein
MIFNPQLFILNRVTHELMSSCTCCYAEAPSPPKQVLQKAISLEMADISTPLEGPLPGDAGYTKNIQRNVGNMLTDGAVGWVSVPAELQYGYTVGDHHNPLPCQCGNSIRRKSKHLQSSELVVSSEM